MRSAQPKRPTRREIALTTARVAGYENDTRAFTRLFCTSHVASCAALNEAWRAGVALRQNAQEDSDHAQRPRLPQGPQTRPASSQRRPGGVP